MDIAKYVEENREALVEAIQQIYFCTPEDDWEIERFILEDEDLRNRAEAANVDF